MRVCTTPRFRTGARLPFPVSFPAHFPETAQRPQVFGKTGRYVRVKGHRNQERRWSKRADSDPPERVLISTESRRSFRPAGKNAGEKTQKRRLESWLSVTSH